MKTRSNLTANIDLGAHGNDAKVGNGAKVINWDEHGGKNQKWTLEGKHIESHLNGKVMRRQGNHEGSTVIMWAENDASTEKWRLLPGKNYTGQQNFVDITKL